MKPIHFLFAALLLALFFSGDAQIPKIPGAPTRGDLMLEKYFTDEVHAISSNCLAHIQSREDWESKRAGYRRQLQEMLGLWPMPEKTDLQPVITGAITNDDFIVQKIYFQASPKLYVTANLFLPRNLSSPAPTILYECGHVSMKTNGVSLGNKAFYQIDGAWFARNGYVCLVLDTVLAGEIQGIHTGTRDHGLWWWNSRGYTPAGVEAWFGIRALDYLCTRSEVDTNRFGITGHSGGGAYSWTITALDDRIKVAAPLAGMADDQSHLFDGVIDSHCDCNFFINIYRWDFPQVAALAAPRPLLIGGTDRDQLFHLDSTMRIYEKVRRIYQLYGTTTNLALTIASGPHMETPELQLAVLRWFNRFLKREEPPVAMAAKRFFPPTELKVFETLPTDSINSNIADSFVPLAKPEKKSPNELRAELEESVFTGWPDEMLPLEPKRAFSVERDGLRFSAWDFTSEHDVPLRFYLLENVVAKTNTVMLYVLNQPGWDYWINTTALKFGSELADEMASVDSPNIPESVPSEFEKVRQEVMEQHSVVFFAPRGVGLTEFSGDDKQLTKIRRRFMLLGQTLDGMRVWDIRRAIQAVHSVRESDSENLELRVAGGETVNTLYAALFEPGVKKLDLISLPESQTEGPDYLGVLKITDIPQVKEAVASQTELKIGDEF